MNRRFPAFLLPLLIAAPALASGDPSGKPNGPVLTASAGLLDCTGAAPITCGGVVNDNNANGVNNAVNYACGSNETGPELVYSLSVAAPTTVQIVLEPAGCDLDLFVLGSCDESDCLASSAGVSTEVVTVQLGTGTSYVVVDGYSGAVCDFELRIVGCTDRTVFRSGLIDTGVFLSLGSEHASLRLDGQDQPRVAYADSSGGIWYAVRAGALWLAEPVDTAGTDFRINPELAVDFAGGPHVAYPVAVGGAIEIRYAKKVGSAWQVESLPVPGHSAGSVYTDVSLAVDALANPHITYADSASNLRYASKSGGFWTTELIQTSAGDRSSLQLDVLGAPSLAFLGGTGGSEVFFARRAGAAWLVEQIDGTAVLSFFLGGCALALDPAGAPHVLYTDADERVRYARRTAGSWTFETPAQAPAYGRTSIAVDGDGTPHIAYNDVFNSGPAIWYGRRVNGSWVETLAAASPVAGNVPFSPSLVLDSGGAPRIAYLDSWAYSLWLAEADAPSFSVTGPAGGAVWPVGSMQTVSWAGGLEEWFDAQFHVCLSVDGGHTYERLVTGARGESVAFRVPHVPTRYARIKVERADPFEAAVSDSFFTIDASITLTAFRTRRGDDGSVTVTWATKPGPEADVAYRVERSDGGGGYHAVHAGVLRATEHTDRDAPAGATYRIVAVNGLGAEYVLDGPLPAGDDRPVLSARPVPFRGGELAITFATAGGLGGGAAEASVQVFDVSGRRVRDVYRGELPAGYHETVWDGRDESGRPVSPGIYFLRATSGTATAAVRKIAVVK